MGKKIPGKSVLGNIFAGKNFRERKK